MEKENVMEKLLLWFVAGCLCTFGFVHINASEQQNLSLSEHAPESDGNTYAYAATDQDGNTEVVQLAEVDEDAILQEQKDLAKSFDVVVKIGNDEQVIGSYDSLAESEEVADIRNHMRSIGTVKVRSNPDYSKIKYGVVDFHTKNSNTTTNFTETQTNTSGYLNGAYAADGAFIGYCSTDQSKIKFRASGVEGCVSADDVIVREYDDVASVNFYRVENGRIYHYITQNVNSSYYGSVILVGTKQSYMKNDTVYYSYDGHYFYTSYKTMIADYKNNTYEHSINAQQPYYNYFQFITHRTKTNYAASELNSYVEKTVSNASALKGAGQFFINAQNTYGANALLMYGLAMNESARGTSSYALIRNNLFGHAAYDHNSDNATTYDSIEDCIEQHAKYYVSNTYLDPNDYSGLYHGGHLGDKGSGMNVKYASDPYWGEKAASFAWQFDLASGAKDYGNYQIGMIEKMVNLNVRSDAVTNSYALYKTGNQGNYPVMILGQTEGQSINGNTSWYKIQSDATLNSQRTAITQDTYVYDYDRYFGFVASAYVDKVTYTDKQSNVGSNESSFKKGDVNGDGNITSMDYVMVKNHILDLKKLDKDAARAADVSGDGQITSLDYVMIKNHILGLNYIK